MRAAEANLDNFWRDVDDHFGADGKTLLDVLLQRGVQPREINRTPPYMRQSDTPKTTGAGRIQNIVETTEIAIQSHLFGLLMLDDRPQRPKAVESPKQKAKTRGSPVKASRDRDVPVNQPREPFLSKTKPAPSFKVSRRAIKVFNMLFFTLSASTSQPTTGEIPWADFLHAMAAAGCSIEKLQGSLWQFIPKDEDSFGWYGIHFHEPHPSNKISFGMARRMGRRLNRNYGWSAKTFVARGTDEV